MRISYKNRSGVRLMLSDYAVIVIFKKDVLGNIP
jgi:hypothetical protein